MAHSALRGVHFKGPLLGDDRSLGGLLSGFPVDIAARVQVVTWFNDFLRGEADYDDTADWTESTIGTGTGSSGWINTDNAAGYLTLTAGSANDEGIQSEFTGANGAGEFVVPTTDKWFAYGVRFRKTVATSGAIFVGLGETLTTTDMLTATTGALAHTNCIGFWTGEASAAVTLEARRASGSGTGSTAIATLASNTFVDVGFRVEVATPSSDTANGRIIPYAKGSDGRWGRVGSIISGAIPNTGICPSFAVKNEPGAVTGVLDIDYFWVAIER